MEDLSEEFEGVQG